MSKVTDFITHNVNFLNNIQSYHWQTENFAEHEQLREYHQKFDKLNDEFVEAYQGKIGQRIKFSAELRPGIMNYADNPQVAGDVQKHAQYIIEFSKIPEVQGHMDLESVLEDMLLATNQLLFHLTLK